MQQVGVDRNATEALTLEHILTLARVSQVALSPNGAQVAYVQSPASQDGEHPTGCIYLVAADGSMQARPFTGGPGLDTSPRWSPDSATLAFISDRERRGTSQLYIIATDGGEARRLTDERGGVANPQWSPTGREVAYLVQEAETEDEERRRRERDDALVASEAIKRQSLWIIGAGGTDPKRLTPDDWHVWDFAWSPTGDRMALVYSTTPEWNDKFKETTLVVYTLGATPEARVLGPAPLTSDLVWSRDGATVFSLGTIAGGSVEDFAQTFLRAWSTVGDEHQAPRVTLRDLSATPFWLGRGAAADDLLLAAWHGVHTQIYRVDPDGASAEPVVVPALSHGSLADGLVGPSPTISLSADGQHAAVIGGDGMHPNEVWLWNAGGEMRRLTDANPALRRVQLGRQQEISWRSFDGEEIGGLLITPPGYEEGRRYPLVMHIHGGPTWLWTDHCHLDWHDWGQWVAAAGFLVLLPNPRGSAGRGNAFSSANIGDIGGSDYRDVMAGVDYLIAQGLVDENRLGIGGWSYGGTLTPWAISQTDRFRCAVMGAGICNWLSMTGTTDIRIFSERLFWTEGRLDLDLQWERSALRHVTAVKTPTLILHGEADIRVPVSQSREFHSALRHLGVPTELVVYPREGHQINERHHQRDLLTRVRNWYVRYLLGGEERDSTAGSGA